MIKKRTFLLLIALIVGTLTLSACSTHSSELVIYSSRQAHLLDPLTTAFKKETGIDTTILTGGVGPLIERIKLEKKDPKADILFTVDAGNLWMAAENNLLEPVQSAILNRHIPSYYKDPENRWFGFSLRARSIIYNPNTVSENELSTYEDLASSKWKDRLLLRTSKKVYNQSLVATMIERLGRDNTEKVLRGWVSNLAAPVFSSDTQVIKAVASGQGDVGIVNSYYLAREIDQNPDIPVKLFWANQQTSGVHVNVSGAGMIKNAPQNREAKRFLEWLASDTAQEILARSNHEFPVVSTVKSSPIVNSWGSFNKDKTPLVIAGERQIEAVELMDKAGYK